MSSLHLKLKSSGRGHSFSPKRGVFEAVARVLYWKAWPARLLDRLPWPRQVDVVRHTFPLLPARAGRTRPLRIAFASDLHIGPITPPALLDRAFALLAAEQPDVLVLGGDYVFLDATAEVARRLEAWVASVPAPVKLAVMGNHDLWTDNRLLEDALARAGATVLVNDARRLPAPYDDVAIAGLDEVWTGAPDAAHMLAAAGDAALTLAVAHSPAAVPLLVNKGLRLLMCGHTHGGQVALPSGPVVVHGHHSRIWPCGLYDLGDMQLFVSRGLGCVEIPLRMYANPDIAVFTIAPSS